MERILLNIRHLDFLEQFVSYSRNIHPVKRNVFFLNYLFQEMNDNDNKKNINLFKKDVNLNISCRAL